MAPEQPIRTIFLGTPMFSVAALKALHEAPEIDLLAAITPPDKPAGRGQKLSPPAIKTHAQELGIQVFQTKSIKRDKDLQQWLRDQHPDFFVTVAFGQILSQAVLDIPKLGTVNAHASLLPEYRGANPIQQAILDGKKVTGITTMLTDIGVDTGDMLLTAETPITPEDTTGSLAIKLSGLAGPLLVNTLKEFYAGTLTPTPQDHDKSTHAPKCEKSDARINWQDDAETLHNKIRGFQPAPGAYSMLNGQRVKLIKSRVGKDSEENIKNPQPGLLLGMIEEGLQVHTGQGTLDLLEVQPEGKRKMPARDWANGALGGLQEPVQFDT